MEQDNQGGIIQKFFKNDLPATFACLFKKPSRCVENFVGRSNGISVATPLCMMALTLLVTMLLSWLMLMKTGITDFMEGGDIFGICFKSGLVPVIYGAILTLLLFVAMAIKSCTDFKLAFFNVTVHLMVLCLVLIVTTILMMTVSKDKEPGAFYIIVLIATLLYALTWAIGNVKQALMSISGDDTYSWWMAPLVVALSLTFTYLIVKNMVLSSINSPF